MLTKTRLSFLYVIFYLTTSGLSLTFFPQWGMKLMFSTGTYDDIFMRLAGVLLLGLASIVFQIFRTRAESLYTTLIWVRVMFCSAYVVFYLKTQDPFFITLLVIVGFGLLASVVAYAVDRKSQLTK